MPKNSKKVGAQKPDVNASLSNANAPFGQKESPLRMAAGTN
jgi:hypothetical protein